MSDRGKWGRKKGEVKKNLSQMLASDASAGKMVSTNQLNSFVHHGMEESGQVKLKQLIQKSFAEEWINSLL